MPLWLSPWQTTTRQAIYPSFPGLYLRDESAYYPSWLGSNVAGNKNNCGFYATLNLFHSKAKKCIFNSHSTCSSRYVGWLCFEYFIDFHGNAKDVIGIFCCFATDGFRMMEIFFNEGVAFQGACWHMRDENVDNKDAFHRYLSHSVARWKREIETFPVSFSEYFDKVFYMSVKLVHCKWRQQVKWTHLLSCFFSVLRRVHLDYLREMIFSILKDNLKEDR